MSIAGNWRESPSRLSLRAYVDGFGITRITKLPPQRLLRVSLEAKPGGFKSSEADNGIPVDNFPAARLIQATEKDTALVQVR